MQKVPHLEGLTSNCSELFRVVYKGLLAHAEEREDIVEGFLGGDLAFTGDFGKVGKDEAEVFGNEVTCKAGFETVEDALEIHVSVGERFVVTSIGNDDVVTA